MERRYYLRGLGVGIAVTAVIMGVMTSRDAKMTDREVIARAKELGMVESTVLLGMGQPRRGRYDWRPGRGRPGSGCL